MIKALIGELPDEERIITIEGRHELMLCRDFPEKNIIEYETDEEDALIDPCKRLSWLCDNRHSASFMPKSGTRMLIFTFAPVPADILEV